MVETLKVQSMECIAEGQEEISQIVKASLDETDPKEDTLKIIEENTIEGVKIR